MRASMIVLLSFATCVRAAEPTTAQPRPATAPVTGTAVAPSGWWCYVGRYPDASRSSSRCMRAEDECNRSHADAQSDGYEADTDSCFHLELAHCTAFPTGAELCRAKAEHCEAARRVFSGRPGRPAEVPPCEQRR